MNAKLAKKLRQLSRVVAASIDVTEYRVSIENEKNRKVRIVPVTNDDGVTVNYPMAIAAGTITNSENSIRGVYRKMKKDLKRAGSIKAFVERPEVF